MHQFFYYNHASFDLCLKENLLSHQKFWKYSEHDCLQNFLSLFMSLLVALIDKSSRILAGIYFIFPKNPIRLGLKGFQLQTQISVESSESGYQVKFWHVFAKKIL